MAGIMGGVEFERVPRGGRGACVVPRVGLEPTPLSRPDFESGVATDYATEAGDAALAMCLRRGRIIT